MKVPNKLIVADYISLPDRFLVKAWEQAETGNTVTPTVSYLVAARSGTKVPWDHTPEGIIRSFEGVAAGFVSKIYINFFCF